MSEIKINKLPFYWRLCPPSKRSPNIVADYFPFSFEFDHTCGLAIQKRDPQVLKALDCIYQQEYNIGYLQDTNEIAKPYGNDFVNYLLSTLRKNSSIRKILEIGCGGCVVLEKLKAIGYDVCGIDSSPFALSEGKKKGVDVIVDFFPSAKIPDKFDLIFHVDVLEHIDNYIEFLSHQHNQLSDDGVLIVNVPDATQSIEIGDISQAMHQHLNYFTEASLSNVLAMAGFSDIEVSKAGYGGSLYAFARKKEGYFCKKPITSDDHFLEFSRRANNSILVFDRFVSDLLSKSKRTLGFYVPLRALPYISSLEIYDGFRFFDDTNHWHMNAFDGIDVPIENFDDLCENPVTDLVIMSLTFGEKIRAKILSQFNDKINVLTLSDLIQSTATR